MPAACSTGHAIAPIFLRFALGVTFLWAGFGKVLETFPVKGEAAATLANLGVLEPSAPAESAKPTTPAESKPAVKPETKPDSKPAPANEPKKDAPPKGGIPPLMQTTTTPIEPPTARVYVAGDFPNEVRVRNVHGISLLLVSSANPPAGADGTKPMPLVPAFAASGRWPVYLAWTATMSELLGGLFVLVGLLTRLSSFFLFCTMVTAIWLSQIGPAIQSGNSLLGFLPNHPAYATDAAGNAVFAILMWQLMLACASLALVFSGPGALSFDRALFPPAGGGRRSEPDAKE
ncbi:MAG: DoxX family membrane protein [Planctomycetes bacterium]|nr:DoxX family membrane protein [Planctomycetota bacterium]